MVRMSSWVPNAGVVDAVHGRAGDAGSRGGRLNGVSEQFSGGPGRRRGGASVRTVDADHGVEVDQAAPLVLGDLGEGDAGVRLEGPLGEPGPLGDLAAQVD
jgi:hypothetical protein